MFDFSVLNLTPGVYEAIIAAFIMLGLVQSVALRRKWYQAAGLKSALIKLGKSGTIAICATVAESAMWRGRAVLASARADAMQERAEDAERRLETAEKAAMELAADVDDIMADRPVGRGRAAAEAFGDSHVGQTLSGVDFHEAELRTLFSMLGRGGRNAAALDELIFGNAFDKPNVNVVHGGDYVSGTVPLRKGPVFLDIDAATPENIIAELEKRFGGEVVGIEIGRKDGQPMTATDRDAALKSFGLDGGETGLHPSFDPVDALAAGTAAHEHIEQPSYHTASSPRAG